MKGVVDRYLRAVGIVTEGVIIRTSTASSPAGDSTSSHTRWIAGPPGLLPARAGARRRSSAASCSACSSRPSTAELSARDGTRSSVSQLKQAARKTWVVYSKPPFAGAEQVLAYLGRYAYRIALSNDRLVDLHDGQVTFRWKDRAHGQRPPTRHPRCPRLPAPLSAPRLARTASSGSATTASSPTRCAPRHSSWSGSGSPRRPRRGPLPHRPPHDSQNGGTRCCSD